VDGGVVSPVAAAGVTTVIVGVDSEVRPAVSRAYTENRYSRVAEMLPVMVAVVTLPSGCDQ
jgi:hypothetical protein